MADDIARIEAALEDLLHLIESVRVHETRMQAAGLRLSRTQLGFLAWLADNGATPVSQLAARADVSQPAASRALGQLEAEGYVERLASFGDARVNLMSITAAGLEAREVVLRIMRLQLGSALKAMGEDDRHSLAALLCRLVGGLRDVRMEEM